MALTRDHIVRHNIRFHAFFWTTWIVFFSLLQSMGQGSNSFLMWFWYYLLTLPVFVIHTYLVAYWLVPAAFLKSRYGWFAAGLILLLVVFSVLELVLSNEFIFKWVNPAMIADENYLKPANIVISGIGNHYIILVFMSVKVGMAWYRSKAEEEEKKQLNLNTAIETYNYQFQPRVIYHLMVLLGCAIQKELKKSSELIVLISGFLNVFLNGDNNQNRNLAKEIKLLEMYFNIFTSSLPGKVKAELTAEGSFTSVPAPDYLFFPIIDYTLNLGKWCNNSCSCSVFIREEGKRLHFSMLLCCEKKLKQKDSIDFEVMSKQFHNKFQGNACLKEEKGDTFWKLEADVFCC